MNIFIYLFFEVGWLEAIKKINEMWQNTDTACGNYNAKQPDL